jgi:trehalose/maltose hydrolase-like predicted phosphorylase
VEARRACTLQIEAAIDADVWDLNGPHLRGFGASTADGILSVTARTAERGVQIAVSQLVQAAPPPGTLRTEAARASRPFEAVVTADAPFTLTLYAALCHGEDALARSRALCAEAARSGFPKLLAEHGAQWEERWERCGVTIQGDAEADDALRFSMYHLLSVAPVHGHDASIPARGLSGQMYKGAIFWDTEIFMLPFFSFAFPEIARTLLLYRHRTLDGARRKAQEYGYRGAFFAWESQDTGDDACTLFNVTDVFTNRPLRTYFRDKQVHISADIVYAFWRYIAVTGDEGILLDGGAEVIYECCRFLLSTLYYSREKGRYEMLDVTGPDEYHERVHNNCYTNWMTGYAFDVCLRIAGALHASAPDRARELLQRLSFEEDLRAIEEVSTRLYRPGPRGHARVVPQFDGYLALRDVPVTELLARKLHPHEYLGGGNGLAVPTQVIKQADVVLGLALLPDELAREDRRASWEYYEPRTEHGSSLSACAYALVAAEIGRGDEAYRYFMKAATIDRDGASKSHVGTLYIGGTHPASNGGAWMAAIMGLCEIGRAHV